MPAGASPVAVGAGAGDSYTIAGYGTASEAARGAFGSLRKARLVRAEPYALVDPNRKGSIGASACYGDSGGPVLRGSALIGVISRAAHPHPRIACGHLTRYAPVVATEEAEQTTASVAAETGAKAKEPRRGKQRTMARRTQVVETNPFPWAGRVD